MADACGNKVSPRHYYALEGQSRCPSFSRADVFDVHTENNDVTTMNESKTCVATGTDKNRTPGAPSA